MTILHNAFAQDNVAVVTGAASGIGLAAARKFASFGMSVVLVDLDGEKLAAAQSEIAMLAENGNEQIVSIPTDVSKLDELEALERAVIQRFGRVHVLMNNAGVQPGSAIFGPQANWDKIFGVNLMGVVNGSRVFGSGMLAHGEPGLIINTGSKQGITTPPGDPAYNVSKAGVKAFTEALEYELRNAPNGNVSAHLLIPGFVFTGLTANGRTEKPSGAWTGEQTVDFMIDSIGNGDFYILCPDGEVDRKTDEKRILWAANDLVENRPPLSRWHEDYSDDFKSYLKS
ncbi:SDR family NAD(P)-dependent oxidoreductase [Agrobacterium rosae]|uniref:Putative oxidoreductase SadH n=1 Tax=Agrobacterium rosae TaxID=1972867 RepID=A0A1R3U1W6_9HYPH|nr:SDR family NAD(P)-dependent oxidoreductase [Agrobacterium rosae]KAA3510539.1 SDR family NAD(P)-dependent oxidoreductase [Agrobacterium rosae]KAA3517258.1 SDR family NAD(P)-dependent oxidoreductase [Agrobacterium rosae]MCM2434716.1 SDR family NAD(P)-dependent oxidoreductase [Agrobacterium rosae]MDX8330258.1 SDR family NAD(P)-dependent oxidoreductase [Agrobacterium rosae]MQB49997.1 SDR family NAD(P)-dependent oxidoreductase [Agrobacterium rosae]